MKRMYKVLLVVSPLLTRPHPFLNALSVWPSKRKATTDPWGDVNGGAAEKVHLATPSAKASAKAPAKGATKGKQRASATPSAVAQPVRMECDVLGVQAHPPLASATTTAEVSSFESLASLAWDPRGNSSSNNRSIRSTADDMRQMGCIFSPSIPGGMGGGAGAGNSAGGGAASALVSPFPPPQPLLSDSGRGSSCEGSSFVSPTPPPQDPPTFETFESEIIDGRMTDVGSFVDSLFVAGDVPPIPLPHTAAEWFGP